MQDLQPFIIKGFHSTVSACTLPSWLPSFIIDSMILHFATELRQEFIDLKNCHKLLRDRVDSTGLQEISIDNLVSGSRKIVLQNVLDQLPNFQK